MNSKKIVVALGHSALGKTFPEQKEAVKNAAAAIADLIEAKYQVVITHSNGPQVGMIHSAMTEYSRLEPSNTVDGSFSYHPISLYISGWIMKM